MRKLIICLSLLICFNAWAEEINGPSWKTRLRQVVTRVAGIEWSDKIFGALPVEVIPEIVLPKIPVLQKKSTDVESYNKKVKDPTEYDNLPQERKRQFNYKFIEELYLVTRKTEAKDEDLSNWLNTLDQGGSREGIYQALVLDEVYSGLESMEEKPSQKLLNFTLQFSQKFLNQTFKTDSLTQLNLYSLKRIFTEKSLDLIEYFEVKDIDSLYRWYAIFSSDMASSQSPFLGTSAIRLDRSAKYHYDWAKAMPIQHIKSEFIIKIHSVMNGIQLLP